jgi:hypothetical protein
MVATYNSVQMAKLLATPVQHIRSDEHGRVRCAIFEWAPGAVDPGYAAGDTLNLCKLPPGARVLGGRMWWEANTATAALSVGIAGAVTKYSAAIVITNASVVSTIAGVQSGLDLGGGAVGGGTIAAPVMGEVQASAVTIIGTNSVAALAVSKRVFGYVLYLGVE